MADSPSAARTTLAASESAPLIDLPLAAQVVDANPDWEVRDILGKKVVDREIYYLMD